MYEIGIRTSLFLSHLSGDEAINAVKGAGATFLSHLSGDEVALLKLHCLLSFLSHLSGDEEGSLWSTYKKSFLSHFLHYPTMGKVVDIGTFRMQNSL